MTDDRKTCAFRGCVQDVVARDLCRPHYEQQRAGKPLSEVRDPRRYDRNEDGFRMCRWCKRWLPDGCYSANSKARDGLTIYCKSCVSTRHHGLLHEDVTRLLVGQLGLCELCDAQMRSPYVDHDHTCCAKTYSCGRCVRALVCRNCNSALGLAKDDPVLLRRMADYIERGRLD